MSSFVYRLDQSGKPLYKFPLPRYGGALQDEMVLGEHDRGFVTRGGTLIAFDVRDGTEIWRWDSRTPEVEVYVGARKRWLRSSNSNGASRSGQRHGFEGNNAGSCDGGLAGTNIPQA
jgi:outer membrane protein assembly factor BamB